METHEADPGVAALRAFRYDARLSLRAMGPRLGVSYSTIAAWEHGRMRPSFEAALVLEALSRGKVRVELWGYPTRALDAARKVLALRDAA